MEFVVRFLSAVAATIVLPFALLRGLFNHRWRLTLPERFGRGAWADAAWQNRDTIWFHGASVGEVVGLAPLITEIRRRYPELQLLVTTTSLSGRDEMKRRRLADRSLIFPFDHPLIVGSILSKIRPRMVIIAETELWPNFLFAAKKLNVPVVVVNGRISDYSFPRYLRLRALFRPLLRSLRLILVQTKVDADRYLAIGAADEQLSVAGSTKYSSSREPMSNDERKEFAARIGIDLGRPCFVAGSIRSGEDESVIRAYAAAKRDVPELQMIVAPRHPERFERVAQLLYMHGIQFNRRSNGPVKEPCDVVLFDTMGELYFAYGLGTFSFVGGSLVNIGGHNPFEPASCRNPVLFGPYRANVKDMVDELEHRGGLFVVRNEDELVYAISRLAQNPDECLARGARAYEVWRRNSGALERVVPRLDEILAAEPASAGFARATA